ncbi:endonuclease VII domain-containing protein [Actinomadura fibrosa]|uniref:Endonuclease VII domain-containing protein n=1 Tax=Actinomadura fibrosa TaxID=111802 RepID=A0ABW2XVU5_9ACTN|nr:endonuclease VII domain-containing protein [Actinomadura fibrosa]
MKEIKTRNHGSERGYLLKLRYGITEQEADAMLAMQGGVCVICLRKEAKHVDHGHWTGRVRSMLCFGCNGGLGQFEEDPRCLGAAADYLEFRGPHARGMLLEFGSTTLAGPPRRKEEEWWRRRRSAGLSRQSNRQNHLRRRYGLEEADVRRLLDAQGGLCAVCWDVPAEHVDHDHATGAVRGIACGACNTGMGQLGDDPTSLRRAADYLLGQLVREVPTADGGTRLSFTVPDVDPVTVPLDGWEGYREADGRFRRDAWEVADDHEGPTWLDRCLDEILAWERAISEEYARSG